MKKKLLLFATALFALTGNMMAQDNVTLSDVTIMPGKTATMEIGTDFTSDIKQGFQIEFKLPEGIEVTGVEFDDAFIKEYPDFSKWQYSVTSGVTKLVTFAMASTPLEKGKYPVATATLKCADDVEVDEYTVTTSIVELVDVNNKKINPEASFKITVIPYAARILDESATSVPEASIAAEDVIINRALKAGNWATICLPFALDADQIAEVFGANTIVADYTDHEINDANTEITLYFEKVTEMEANHPYIIKPGNTLKEIKVADVLVSADEEEAVVVYNAGTARKPDYRGWFYGIMHATKVPDKKIYLNGNKFYVSANDAAIKAYRGYFEILDFEENFNAGANINILVDGDATAIEGITINGRSMNTGDVYTVSGMYMGRAENVMNTLPAGIYIVNNKKVIIK